MVLPGTCKEHGVALQKQEKTCCCLLVLGNTSSMAAASSRTDPRVVALIDMDCFYCACERALDPSLVGVPMAVVQYNPYQNAHHEDGNVGGVVSLPAEPASARVVYKVRMVTLIGTDCY